VLEEIEIIIVGILEFFKVGFAIDFLEGLIMLAEKGNETVPGEIDFFPAFDLLDKVEVFSGSKD
jgi:hypothetical protein